MSGQLIDGKALATSLRQRLKTALEQNTPLLAKKPGLAVILIGDDPASTIYVRHKRLACEEIGIASFYYHLPVHTTQAELSALISELNNRDDVHGILIQAPLPPHLSQDELFEQIAPTKDVDGFHPYNIGRLLQRRPALRPCTPYGVILLLNHIRETYKGRHAVVIGASNIVGRPMACELLIAGATVTICHRFTGSLQSHIAAADIVVSAVGKQNLIQGAWIKPGATVIDVGQIRLPNGQITGDVEFDAAKANAAWITPVPGGVGPMTVTVLLHNTLLAAGYPAVF